MVLENYFGTLRFALASTSDAVTNMLLSIGIQPPLQDKLSDALIITGVVVFISAILSAVLGTWPLLSLRKRDRRDTVVLVGISGDGDAPSVGKTSLFNALRYGRQSKFGCVPSMQPNIGIFAPVAAAETSFRTRWLDFPGHARLRPQLAAHLSRATGVVFVIDASRFSAQARRDAELLFEVLTHAVVARNQTPVLVFCNKCDGGVLPTRVDAVRVRLEAELERVRNARARDLRAASVPNARSGADADAETDNEPRAMLGYENEAFSFDHAASLVTFATGSATESQVDEVIAFARKCVA